jgi:hypothetical protein
MNVLSSHDKPKTTIRYTLVNTGDDEKAARFAAWLRRDGDKWDPLSVKQWAECIASDKDSATLAADFSKVITVRLFSRSKLMLGDIIDPFSVERIDDVSSFIVIILMHGFNLFLLALSCVGGKLQGILL